MTDRTAAERMARKRQRDRDEKGIETGTDGDSAMTINQNSDFHFVVGVSHLEHPSGYAGSVWLDYNDEEGYVIPQGDYHSRQAFGPDLRSAVAQARQIGNRLHFRIIVEEAACIAAGEGFEIDAAAAAWNLP